MTIVHPTAVVSPGANLASGVQIGPFAVVEAGAQIGDDVVVGIGAVVHGGVTIAREARIGAYTILGGDPQHLGFDRRTPTRVEIGRGTVIHEHATVHRATGPTPTRIGADCMLMSSVHVAHDCRIGDGVVIGNGSGIAGHVRIGNRATVGGMAGVHQWVRIGELAAIGGMTAVLHDVLPFCVVSGSPARHIQINRRGMTRHGFTEVTIQAIRRAFTAIRDGRPVDPVNETAALLDTWNNPGPRGGRSVTTFARRGTRMSNGQP
ncbi:acyl-ACP--UDP-N-acetylglucosamine O-acyltransferase [Kibdelosporangium aridum]|uniref:acyl-ACP--UDP-N-acetylglucosamine O-acyltransferase n=1 Tax=Kibdelosporangium aridum TaxID=2030 RepID=UPI00135B8B6F|nr:acyl-ACP--UDP-N-acetylglucosamine O-acyltransferase [Kibdelosporangium aridum]